ncbi:MAG: hypothetical protein ACK5ZC_10060 [Pirellulaceae bacterium]|jgi:hypothetical protein
MKLARLLVEHILWVAFACLLAGLFGALHNQISFTVSQEYFTRFKFIQFRIPTTVPPRLGASIVGWLASWWMGPLLAACILPFAHCTSQPTQRAHRTGKAFAIVVVVAAAIGLLGLLLAMVTGDPETIEPLSRYGNAIDDDLAFARAGTMHNFSYLGAAVGCMAAIFWLFKSRHASS